MSKVEIDNKFVGKSMSLLVLGHNLEGASKRLTVSIHVDRVIFAEVYLPEAPAWCSLCRSNVRAMQEYTALIEIVINIRLNLQSPPERKVFLSRNNFVPAFKLEYITEHRQFIFSTIQRRKIRIRTGQSRSEI